MSLFVKFIGKLGSRNVQKHPKFLVVTLSKIIPTNEMTGAVYTNLASKFTFFAYLTIFQCQLFPCIIWIRNQAVLAVESGPVP